MFSLVKRYDPMLPVDRIDDLFDFLRSDYDSLARADHFIEDGVAHIKCEMPGFKKEDISISIDDGYISIDAKHENEKKNDNRRYFVYERKFENVSRKFAIPNGIDMSSVKASYKDGVLNVTYPVESPKKIEPKKISVE